MLTAGITALKATVVADIVAAVARFEQFDADNDPHGEHDCAVLEVGGKSIIWKVDYYDRSLTYGSEDPADTAITTRVLTIMLSEEFEMLGAVPAARSLELYSRDSGACRVRRPYTRQDR